MLKSIAVAVFATAFSSVAATAQDFDLQGHRGARGLALENTLAAFAHALTIGVTTLELDVGVNRDGVVVISHNPRLNPVITRRDGAWLSADGPAIFSLNAAELRAYDVGRINPASRYAARVSCSMMAMEVGSIIEPMETPTM
jgi:glycerophosphoryl diester phosphodiesterase